jgi:hypothetical protein
LEQVTTRITLRPERLTIYAWQWLTPILGAFLQSSDDQQVHLTGNLFTELDFRRFNIDMTESIGMDGAGKIPELSAYGDKMWEKVKNDITEPIPSVKAAGGPGRKTVPPPDH